MGILKMTEVEEGCFPGMKAPEFSSLAFHKDKIGHFELSSLKGKWVLLVFYPIDFGYIAPSELIEINRLKEDRVVVAVSTGSCLSKSAWASIPFEKGGIEGVDFPLVEDLNFEISKKYGMLKENRGFTYRGFFLVCPEGFILYRSTTDLSIGLGVKECMRLYDAAKAGCTPPGWTPGTATMQPTFYTDSLFPEQKAGAKRSEKENPSSNEPASNVDTKTGSDPSMKTTTNTLAINENKSVNSSEKMEICDSDSCRLTFYHSKYIHDVPKHSKSPF